MIRLTRTRPLLATLGLSGAFFFSALFAITLSTDVRAQNKSEVLASINNKVITLEEFNRRFEQNSQLVPGATPSKEDVLKNIIYFELATQEARDKKIHLEQALKINSIFCSINPLLGASFSPRLML